MKLDTYKRLLERRDYRSIINELIKEYHILGNEKGYVDLSNSNKLKTFLRESNFIKPPINKNLPFFAYGFYKPHQLAYPTIQEFIDGTPKKSKIRAKLKQINGIPVLIEADYNNYQT